MSDETAARNRATSTLGDALVAAKNGDLDGAERLAQEAREQAPGFIDPLFALAAIAERRADTEAARARYLQILTEDPTQTRAGVALATTYLQEGRFDEAAEWLRRAIEADPGAEPAYFNLGSLAESRGDLDDAVAWLRLSAVLDVNDPRATTRIAAIRLRQGRTRDARLAVDAALQRAPNHAPALALREEILRAAPQ